MGGGQQDKDDGPQRSRLGKLRGLAGRVSGEDDVRESWVQETGLLLKGTVLMHISK